MDEFSRELACALTDEEVAARSDRLARAFQERDIVDAERSEAGKGFKRQLDALTVEMRLLGNAVRDRSEMREVECATRLERDGTVLVIRQDTGEVIEQRHADPGTQLRLRMEGKEMPDEEDERDVPEDPLAGYLPEDNGRRNGTEEIGTAASGDTADA